VIDTRAAAAPAHSLVAPDPAKPVADGKLIDGTVLLVEDSLIIAMDAEDILTGYGATRVVTASSVAAALEELADGSFALAVLDVNLGTETSLPIAEALLAKGVKFVFATGYGEQLRLPDALKASPILQKPYTAANLGRAIEALLRG
jgi:CheY-like chemotaxis protein